MYKLPWVHLWANYPLVCDCRCLNVRGDIWVHSGSHKLHKCVCIVQHLTDLTEMCRCLRERVTLHFLSDLEASAKRYQSVAGVLCCLLSLHTWGRIFAAAKCNLKWRRFGSMLLEHMRCQVLMTNTGPSFPSFLHGFIQEPFCDLSPQKHLGSSFLLCVGVRNMNHWILWLVYLNLTESFPVSSLWANSYCTASLRPRKQ